MTTRTSQMETCALCERAMRPGQRRARLADDRKAHSSCAAIADQSVGIAELEKVFAIDDATEVAAGQPEQALIALMLNERIAAAVKAATEEAIPSKATLLRQMMTQAADSLIKHVDAEANAASYSKTMTPSLVASIVRAATVLRTVAIYVMDEPVDEDRSSSGE